MFKVFEVAKDLSFWVEIEEKDRLSLGWLVFEIKTMDPKLELHTWHNTVRQITISVSEEIPTVGAAVSTLLGVFWPKDEKTVFQLAEKEVTELIDKKIREFEFGLIIGLVGRLKISLKRYKEMGLLSEDLRTVVDNVDGLFSHLKESTYVKYLMPQIITTFQTHLMVLKELKYHQKNIYKGTLTWEKDVMNTYNKYKELVEKTYASWNRWRSEQIETNIQTNSGNQGSQNYGHTWDKVSGERVDFIYEGGTPHRGFKEEVLATKDRMLRMAQAKFAGIVCHCWEFKSYLRNELYKAEEALSKLQYLIIGPYSSATVGVRQAYGYYGPSAYKDNFQGEDPADTITIYSGKVVYGMELDCDDMHSGIIGERKGKKHALKQAYEVYSLKGQHRFVGAKMKFSKSVLCSICFISGAEGHKNTSSEMMGDGEDWNGKSIEFDLVPNFALTGVAYAVDHSNDAEGKCLTTVGFYFRYHPFRGA